EANGVNGEGFERPDPGIGVGEEQLGEDEAGNGAVEEEVVPFDGRADGRRNDRPAQLDAVFVRSKLLEGGGVGCGHGVFSRRSPQRGGTQFSKTICDATRGVFEGSWYLRRKERRSRGTEGPVHVTVQHRRSVAACNPEVSYQVPRVLERPAWPRLHRKQRESSYGGT